MTPRSLVRLNVVGLLLGGMLLLVVAGTAGGAQRRETAPVDTSGAALSAHLTGTSFKPAEAGSVRLVYRFSRPSKHFAYRLTRKSGAKWLELQSVSRTGNFKGSHSISVKELFSSKPVEAGRYRLELTADRARKLLAFTVIPACVFPTIELTHVPRYGSSNDLQGRVFCAAPATHKVAVYIYVGGWWTKPDWSDPLTSINRNGTWTSDITTGGVDQTATRIAAFLVPNGYRPPSLGGEAVLPAKLKKHALASVTIVREPVSRTIRFSGYDWYVKAGKNRLGPGPNYFSSEPKNVWVDNRGRLHLRIVSRGGRWYCSEVSTANVLGYGTYTFTLASRVDQLDKNVVLGLFTWDDTSSEHANREIDIEFSRWGEDVAQNAQYVVQPWDTEGNRLRFDLALSSVFSTHSFKWSAHNVLFSSHQGHPPTLGDEIEAWSYAGADVPPEGLGDARINLWLTGGTPPSDGQSVEIVVESFSFTPGA